jgi:periplasmic divalent cation tolerance protein
MTIPTCWLATHSCLRSLMAMLIAWTTVATAEEADRLAAAAIERGLAVCVQIDGPVTSHYRWEGKAERAREHRLMFKFLPGQQQALEAWLHAAHPYATPEWVVVRTEHVGEKYLSWALGGSSSLPL